MDENSWTLRQSVLTANYPYERFSIHVCSDQIYEFLLIWNLGIPIISFEDIFNLNMKHQLLCYSFVWDDLKNSGRICINLGIWDVLAAMAERETYLGLILCQVNLRWRHGALRWRRNGRDGVSNHQPHDCLLNRLFGCRSKKTSRLRVTGLCAGNSPVTGEFLAQKASNVENVSI